MEPVTLSEGSCFTVWDFLQSPSSVKRRGGSRHVARTWLKAERRSWISNQQLTFILVNKMVWQHCAWQDLNP
ncbi:hypothetical protein SRHO_G00230810 [Serrasalmus rhombeus]